MDENKKRIVVAVAAVIVGVGLYFGGQATVKHAQAAKQTELNTYQAEQQAQLEAAKKAELEAAAEASKITLAPIPSNSITTTAAPAQSGSQETPRPIPSATITTEPDGSTTIIPDFEAQAAAASQLQKPGEKVNANMSGAGGDLPLDKDGAYHGDHPATPAPKATVNPGQGSGQETPQPAVSAGSPEASAKPSEATQKPTVSQRPTPPASTPTATTEPPTASQKPNGDDSGSGDKPEVTPKPSQDQGGSDTPPSYTGKNGEIRGEWGWLDGFGWIKIGGSDGGTGGDDSDVVTGGLTGHKVGNM